MFARQVELENAICPCFGRCRSTLPIYVTDLRVGRLFMNRPMTETFHERETDRKSDRESERERIK